MFYQPCYEDLISLKLGFKLLFSMIYLFRNINLYFIQQGCMKLFKTESKDISNVTKNFYHKEMLLFWTLYSPNNPEIVLPWYQQKYKIVYNITKNDKWFFSTKSTYDDSWRIMWPWRLEWWLLKKSALPNYILECITIILNCNNISEYYCFTVFLS